MCYKHTCIFYTLTRMARHKQTARPARIQPKPDYTLSSAALKMLPVGNAHLKPEDGVAVPIPVAVAAPPPTRKRGRPPKRASAPQPPPASSDEESPYEDDSSDSSSSSSESEASDSSDSESDASDSDVTSSSEPDDDEPSANSRRLANKKLKFTRQVFRVGNSTITVKRR